LQVVVTGTRDEAEIAAALAREAVRPVVNLAGRTTLGALAVLLSQARLVVSNDTGVSHLAAALRVPSAVIFIASDPRRWAPQDRRLHRPVGGETFASVEAGEARDRGLAVGAGDVPVEAVLDEVASLLESLVGTPGASGSGMPAAPEQEGMHVTGA
jgi:ADP-heptose:LPS heptosyltransferase